VRASRSGPVSLWGRLLRRMLRQNAHLAKMYYHYTLERQCRQYSRPPLLLYQMGKVGSKSLQNSLEAIELDRPLFHVHFLMPERVRQSEKERRKYLGTGKEGLLRHVWQYEYLLKQMAKGLDGRQWKIVTLTREPIGRNISAFFENLDVEALDDGHYHIQSDYYGFETVVGLEDVDKLAQFFFERLRHDSPLVFFDQELKRMFGVDVFASEFPKSKGYKIYRDKQADVLLVRVENLSECACDAFHEFLGIEGFALTDANVASAKVYAPLYRRFRESVVLPEAYVEEMYASKYTQHFYSEGEIARFRAKWHTTGC
jgi:hypothetical protein